MDKEFGTWLVEHRVRAARDRFGGNLSRRSAAMKIGVPNQSLARWEDGESLPTNPDQVELICEFYNDWTGFNILGMSRPLPDWVDRKYLLVIKAAEHDPKVKEQLDKLAFQIAS